ncbi:iron permease FTR1 [Paenibacillus curdlanolyticus YK9]|uniref:Iron permease FTR1 n=1 Tax=Paenibacillus curdlanolyticus YK9 TaxID=717606 RepID=E0IFG6_9BACL|nr:FTR1 family protein [Paenibacillus curdlanolyticus]EFM08942.1 iron permease FTR1 [Paenibacillus curdlanolyticus YK9]
MKIRYGLVIALVLFLGLQVSSAFAAGKTAEENVKQANALVEKAITLVNGQDVTEAKNQFDGFKSQWFEIEQGVKEKSRSTYKEVEDAMGQIEFIFLQDPVNKANAVKALNELSDVNKRFIAGDYALEDPAAANTKGSVSSLIGLLNEAKQALEQGDTDKAKAEIEQFRESWLDIEGIVLSQSASAYSDAERDMVLTYAYLSNDPPKKEEALQTIETMVDYLKPLADKTTYNMLDAVTILLREGLEALLVVVALLAYLKKSGHEDKRKWIWSGVGVGIGVSLILGVIVQVLFSSGVFGSNNFMIAGFTGIFAAIMLLYMTYWLHSNANISYWNQYIKTKSSNALAKGSLWSLAILAFLAVFREGTETVLFLIGMASSISLFNLLLGIGIAVLILIAVAYIMLKFGVKIPIRPFFLVSSLLVFYLCFKFAGMGVHGLQLSGMLPATDVSGLTTIDFLAIYPTWEGLVPQLFLLIAAVGIVIWNRMKNLRLQKQLKIKNI